MTIVRRLSSGLLLGAVALTAATAFAADAKVFPGAMCLNNGYEGESDYLYRWDGAIFNISNHSAHLSCPITRDIVTGDSASVKLNLYNPSEIRAFNCRVVGREIDGAFYYGPTNKEWQLGRYFVKDLGLSSGFATDMTLSVTCLVPQNDGGAAAGIRSYRVSEN